MEKIAARPSPSPFNFWQGVLGRNIPKGKTARAPSGRIGIMPIMYYLGAKTTIFMLKTVYFGTFNHQC
jgi:hypothetical protein